MPPRALQKWWCIPTPATVSWPITGRCTAPPTLATAGSGCWTGSSATWPDRTACRGARAVAAGSVFRWAQAARKKFAAARQQRIRRRAHDVRVDAFHVPHDIHVQGADLGCIHFAGLDFLQVQLGLVRFQLTEARLLARQLPGLS